MMSHEDARLNSSPCAQNFLLLFGTIDVGHRLEDSPVNERIFVTSLHFWLCVRAEVANPTMIALSMTEDILDLKDLRHHQRLPRAVPADIDGVSQEQKWGHGRRTTHPKRKE